MTPFPTPPPDECWVDDDAGPVVRPYAMTLGRTRPSRGDFDLVSLISTTGTAAGFHFGPEHTAIIQMCRRPLSVAEVAAHLDLPLSVVQVFLGDLLSAGLITVRRPQNPNAPFSDRMFEAMLDGLRAL